MENQEVEKLKKCESLSKFFPWRRYFARATDGIIYMYTIQLVLAIFTNSSPIDEISPLLSWFIGLIAVFIFEPILLSRFGTTIGKFIFGIYIYDNQGRKLSYGYAFERTTDVLIFGKGLDIPFFSIYTLIKSYNTYAYYNKTRWDEYHNVCLKRKNIFVSILGVIAIFCFFIVSMAWNIEMRRTPNRGDITVSEYVENFNTISNKVYSDTFYDNIYLLEEDGQATERTIGHGIYIVVNGEAVGKDDDPNAEKVQRPNYVYTEENGLMTGIEFVEEYNGEKSYPKIYDEDITFAIMSFVNAQGRVKILKNDAIDLIKDLVENPYESYEGVVNGVRVIYDVELEGYSESYGRLSLNVEDGEQDYKITFKMYKE